MTDTIAKLNAKRCADLMKLRDRNIELATLRERLAEVEAERDKWIEAAVDQQKRAKRAEARATAAGQKLGAADANTGKGERG